MTPVALAGQLQTAHSEEPCSDLNQVVARAESAILEKLVSEVTVQFALSPNVARVAVSSTDLHMILLSLCAEASAVLGAGGRLLIETRGLNDAQVGSAATTPSDARARLIVRAEPNPALPSAAPGVSPARAGLGSSELEVLLEQLGARLELIREPQNVRAYVAHLPYMPPPNASGRMLVAGARDQLILLVEDEPQVQAVTARILRAFGYSVITAHNERTALAQAEQHGAAIRLVVSDLVLPGVSGTDLVRRLRQPCEHTRVLYMSGYSPEHLGARVEGASFLRKPFTAEELVNQVRELLASSLH